MNPHERISAAIRGANAAGRVGLVPYITAGYPRKEEFIDTLRTISEVADVVEVGQGLRREDVVAIEGHVRARDGGVNPRLATGEIVETSIVDLFGNTTRIAFEGLRVNQSPPLETFKLRVPEGVEVIDVVPPS